MQPNQSKLADVGANALHREGQGQGHDSQYSGDLTTRALLHDASCDLVGAASKGLECTQRAVDNLLASVGRHVTRDIDIDARSLRKDSSI